MRYFVAVGAREIPVELMALPGGGWSAVVEGKTLSVDAAPAGGALSLVIEGRVVDLVLDGAPPEVAYVAFGPSGKATIETDRTRSFASRDRAKSSGASQHFVVAPMPGRIVRLLVAPGDRVETGAPLVVIEAMKMENELRANHAGQVAEVLVRAGDAVEGGAKLIRFEG